MKQNQDQDMDLLQLARDGQQEALENLVQKYTPMVRHIVKNHYARFFDHDDLMQEGMIGLLSAAREYDPAYQIKFSSFAYICILRKIYNIIKHTNGNKHKALNGALSLHSFVNSDETRTLMDIIDGELASPDELIDETINRKRLNDVLKAHLSHLEYTVSILLSKGYTSGEIERIMGVNAKVVDNARTRVKSKLSRLLEKHETLVDPNIPKQVRRRKDLFMDIKLGM